MNPKLLVSSTLLGGLVLFFWGAFSHTAIPSPVQILSDNTKVDSFLATSNIAQGVYMDDRGVFVAVDMLPDRSAKSLSMGPMLLKEFLNACLQAALLLFMLQLIRPTNIFGYTKAGALLGVIAWLGIEVSYWIWYGFSLPLIAIGLIDAGIGFALAGATIGWLMLKLPSA
jgi:hypothetical protein